MIAINGELAESIYVGAEEVSEIYYLGELVWSSSSGDIWGDVEIWGDDEAWY